MRRKVILHGPSSMCVSLPSSWVKKNEINKGAELEMTESGNHLVISNTEPVKNEKKTEISFENMPYQLQKEVLVALYEKGYDEIRIKSTEEGTLKNVYRFLNAYHLGLEITQQEQHSFVLRNVAVPGDEQFCDLFQRVYRITLEFSEKIKVFLKDQNNITESSMLHACSVRRIANYCRRIIIKNNRKYGVYHATAISSLVAISDSISALHQDVCDGKHASRELVTAYTKLCGILLASFELFQRFDYETYTEIDSELKKLNEKISHLKQKQRKTFCCWEHAHNIAKNLSQILPAILSIKTQG